MKNAGLVARCFFSGRFKRLKNSFLFSDFFEHGDGVLFLNRVRNDNAAHIKSVFVRKSVLQFPQAVTVTAAQFQSARLNMNVMDDVGTVNVAGDREQKSGTENITQLQPGQIIAVPETGHFDNVLV